MRFWKRLNTVQFWKPCVLAPAALGGANVFCVSSQLGTELKICPASFLVFTTEKCMKVFYDKDCDLSLIKGKTVAIIGYGSQGHAHAQNLNDSGVKVVVGLRKGGASWTKVGKAGLKVVEVAAAVKAADVVMILLPDEHIAAVYKKDVEPNIKSGASLVFALIHISEPTRQAEISYAVFC